MRIVALTLAVFVVACMDAQAAAPTLHSVGQQDRHPTATYSASGDDVTVYISSSPDRATDGHFLTENLAGIDLLTTDEIAAGTWVDSDQLDPGVYYVMLSSFACEPDCLTGFSAVLSLTVPKPNLRYRGSVSRGFTSASLTFTVTPLGEALPYRVCWTRANRRRKCLRATVDGYSWNEPASDQVTVRTRGMRRRTTFAWYVDGDRVASRRARIR